MKSRLICGVLAATALAGCQSLYQDDKAVPAPAKSQAEAPPMPEAPPPAPPPAKHVARPKPPAAGPAGSPAEPESITVVGLSRPELIKVLGDPVERADRSAGQAWVYRAGPCSVEVLFLFDVVRNEMFAIDRKVSGTDGSPRGEQQCLQRIKASHAS